MINQLPLEWMAYDTALPRSTFLAQQAAFVIASLIGFSAFFALSFMAAETLTRRAFGDHPQLWRAWSRRSSAGDDAAAPGASVQILGLTAGAYLLVPVFLAYDVMLYLRRHEVPRLVVALRGGAAPGRARHLRALALGDRQLLPGRLLGGSAVPRGAARRGGPHRRPLRPAAALPGDRVRRAGRWYSAPGMRRTLPSRRTHGRSS